MNRQNFVDRFYFKNDHVFDDDVGSIGTLKTGAFVDHMQFDLPFKSHTRSRQFKFKAIFISMLKKSWADSTVNLNRHPNHPPGHFLPIHVPPVPFVTLVFFETFVIYGTSPQHKRSNHPPKELPNH